MGFQVAIDGPSGSGKSSVAKATAKELMFIYIDTGAMYRAVGLHIINKCIDFDNTKAIEEQLENINIEIIYEDFIQKIYLNGIDATKLIRTQHVAAAASKVAAIENVRKKLVDIQRTLAKDNDVIMDGRDIGTHVLPNADIKIYLDADVEARTLRRCNELEQLNLVYDFNDIKKEIQERDYNDKNRRHSPLQKACDAVLIDTSNMDIREVTRKIIQMIVDKKKR